MNSLNSSFRSAYNWKARPRSSRKENFTSKWGLSPPDQSIPDSIHFSDRFLAKTLKEKPYFIFNDRLLKKRRPGFTPPIIFRQVSYSIYSFNASGAERIPEKNNLNQT